jgi:aldehyde:ferredoxin oxidoreductase
MLCDDYGMDTISCGVSIGFGMECVEKGLISKEEIGRLDLRFGNGDALLEAIHLIAKRKGIGLLLSEGTKRMAEKIEGSQDFAINVKGMELPGYDPRGMKGQGLTYAVSDRGGCHVRSNTLRTEILGLPEPVDRYGYEEKADMVRNLQLSYTTCDCLIACLFGAFAISPGDYADALRAETGWPINEDDLRIIAERAWNLTRLFNIREGFTREHDTLPPRLFNETSTEGPSVGQRMEKEAFGKMLDEYYALAGWDQKTGIPLKAKLDRLGISL